MSWHTLMKLPPTPITVLCFLAQRLLSTEVFYVECGKPKAFDFVSTFKKSGKAATASRYLVLAEHDHRCAGTAMISMFFS